ncbi:maleylpyruvate isomerase N-terminal domain-containing protein [Kutzneria sp. NPDC051319]|uniref:maleylpyruvate isomerase N-terminal domain-containing protein n=1 Tax=Kutzneria sp. NPDC051319 TaxID=3155047 RepID=UPI00341E6BED
METPLAFPDLLRLIDERSAAFRAAIAAAPDLGVTVPTCPEWTLLDLVHHMGQGRRFWAGIVAAGPSDVRPARPEVEVPHEREAMLAWLADAAEQLLAALREAGPDAGCWSWWGTSQSPRTAGAVARHQVQEISLHTYDAQLTIGAAQPLPDEVALDGVDEFLVTCVSTADAWPHDAADIDYHVTDGPSWRVKLSSAGARVTTADKPADAAATATASDLVLAFYGRVSMDALKLDGDPTIFDQLIAWEP